MSERAYTNRSLHLYRDQDEWLRDQDESASEVMRRLIDRARDGDRDG